MPIEPWSSFPLRHDARYRLTAEGQSAVAAAVRSPLAPCRPEKSRSASARSGSVWCTAAMQLAASLSSSSFAAMNYVALACAADRHREHRGHQLLHGNAMAPPASTRVCTRVRQGPNFEEVDGRRSGGDPHETVRHGRCRVVVDLGCRFTGSRPRDLASDRGPTRSVVWSRRSKTVLFWNAYEAPTGNSVDVQPGHALASMGSGHLGLVAPLGLFGLVVLTWQRRGGFLTVVALGVCSSVVAFFILERFRFPILPRSYLPSSLDSRRWRRQ